MEQFQNNPISPGELFGDHNLPEGIRRWAIYESRFGTRRVDPRLGMEPENPNQKTKYTPEAGNVFEVETYLVDSRKFLIIEDGALEQHVADLFVPNGAVRLPVHPESKDYYEQLLQIGDKDKGQPLQVIAQSSSRTTWLVGDNPAETIMPKLSLDVVIANICRRLSTDECCRSVGTSKLLSAEPNLPKNFHFFPEVLSCIPKDKDGNVMKEGGFIIRTCPTEVATGETHLVPCHTLFGGDNPIFLQMVRQAGEDWPGLARSMIYNVVQQWMVLAVEHGITPEVHGQNLLFEVSDDGLPNGHIWHRDMAGFLVHFDYRDQLGLPSPDLPVVTTLYEDYRHNEEKITDHLGYLQRFFIYCVTYNMEEVLRDAGYDVPFDTLAWVTRNEFRQLVQGYTSEAYALGPAAESSTIFFVEGVRRARAAYLRRRLTIPALAIQHTSAAMLKL